MMKVFWRIAHKNDMGGLWYDSQGNFTGLIHDRYSFCKSSGMQMPFNKGTVGFLSATDSLEKLYDWFPQADIRKLEEFGYRITTYMSENYKQADGHWLIDQKKSWTMCHYLLEDTQMKFEPL